ncbi:TonB-dependent receptor [Sphingobium sp. DEHP117]|uniref:TonB-dependent receptor n=1 Tax=Sphingobium sp. DEHP117 TaxID=2993436 RepID=UPI0027D74BB4|nr:TonB-dependent receptor [Sphingobium sp. DEHP117]MDQ4419235.1 TonB-dependent receptor [Sphingobium sp. DEHP117]
MKPSYVALAATLCLSTPALADDAPADAPDTILVVGQRDAPIEIAPRGLAVSLGGEQFSAVNAANTEDLMKYAPNFFVRKRYAGDSNGVPGFRGTHSTQSARTLAMVDGFVVSNFLGNSFSFAPKWGVVGPGEVQQFDIVYGPYSSRYVGNSMGGIVNITTRDPKETEAFAKVQGMVQPYSQFGTDDSYWGGSAEAGFGLKQKDGPWSLRVTARYFRNEGQPMSFYGLTLGGAGTTPVTGAIIDPRQNIAGSPGTAATPIFAAQSPALITQKQGKVKIGYDDGAIKAQLLFAWWNNRDDQLAPDCYLRVAATGNPVCEGAVSVSGVPYTASGANWSLTKRDEFLLGLKLAAPLWGQWTAKASLSTYQIVTSKGFTSNGYFAGRDNKTGRLSEAGPTGWWTGDIAIERKGGAHELAVGGTASFYRTDTRNYTLNNWRSRATIKGLTTETLGKTRVLSLWAEDVWHITPDAQISAGLRYDDWRAYDGGIGTPGASTLRFTPYPSRHDDALSPTISGQIELNGTLVQLSLATATRFPTVGELFQGSVLNNGTFNSSFDPNLKPEKSRDANLLVRRALGPVTLTGSIFYQRVKNTIFSFTDYLQGPNNPRNNFKNIDRTRQWGIEAIAETKDWPVPGLGLEANAAWIDSKTVRNRANPAAEGVQFPRIPRWRVNANLRYSLTHDVQTSLGLRYASRPNTDMFGLQRGDTFGYTSELFALDARVNWDMSAHFRLSAGVDNITNNRAWVFHPYPQRAFLVEAGWRL